MALESLKLKWSLWLWPQRANKSKSKIFQEFSVLGSCITRKENTSSQILVKPIQSVIIVQSCHVINIKLRYYITSLRQVYYITSLRQVVQNTSPVAFCDVTLPYQMVFSIGRLPFIVH